MKPLDFIGAIELAYDRSKRDDIAWLQDVTGLVAPAFSTTATTSFFYKIANEEAEISNAVSVGEQPYQLSDYQRLHRVGRAAAKRPTKVAYECDMFTLLSRVIGEEAARASVHNTGVQADDSLGLRANMTPTSGLIITTFVDRGFRIRNRNLWTRLAAHLGSALRLRRLQPEGPSPESALAVLSPTGRVEHINEDGGAEDILSARGDLTDAAKNIDRARGKMRRLDQEGASALWRAMVCGEWSLVDWFDHDGKRFLLAQSNRITPPIEAMPASVGRRKKTIALTDREHQIVACASMGHSNKLIAYDLGLSTGTVSVILTRAAKKLGVSGRVALIRAFRESLGAAAAE